MRARWTLDRRLAPSVELPTDREPAGPRKRLAACGEHAGGKLGAKKRVLRSTARLAVGSAAKQDGGGLLGRS
jgi:hypothetical protein